MRLNESTNGSRSASPSASSRWSNSPAPMALAASAIRRTGRSRRPLVAHPASAPRLAAPTTAMARDWRNLRSVPATSDMGTSST